MEKTNCPIKVSTIASSGLNDAAQAMLSRTRAAWLRHCHHPFAEKGRHTAAIRHSARPATTSYLKLLSLEL